MPEIHDLQVLTVPICPASAVSHPPPATCLRSSWAGAIFTLDATKIRRQSASMVYLRTKISAACRPMIRSRCAGH